MKLLSAAALAFFAAAPGLASSTVLDFETVTSFASIGQYYNGGTDGAGVPGPALGVSFGGDVLGLANDVLGPYFSNAPSPLGVAVPVGPDSTMDVAGGFMSRFSFYYSSPNSVANAVQVWSNTNGTGALLASFNLAANAQSGGCSGSPYCHFDQVFSLFNGTARSVTFGNAANIAAFDNINIGAVPEPGTILMMALGLAGLMVTYRRP